MLFLGSSSTGAGALKMGRGKKAHRVGAGERRGGDSFPLWMKTVRGLQQKLGKG